MKYTKDQYRRAALWLIKTEEETGGFSFNSFDESDTVEQGDTCVTVSLPFMISDEEVESYIHAMECEQCTDPKWEDKDLCRDCYDESWPMNESAVLEQWAEVRAHTVSTFGEDDSIALREGFSDWTDDLCKDGQISPELYHNIDNPE